MDFSRFSVAPALLEGAAAADPYRSVFYERLLTELFDNKENLFVKTDIARDRASIFVFPLLHWCFSRQGNGEQPTPASKALYLCAKAETAQSAYTAALTMAGSAENGPRLCLIRTMADKGSEAQDTVGLANCVFASYDAFLEKIDDFASTSRDFGFIVVDQAELVAEMPGESLRMVQGRFLPSWERRSLIIANTHTPRAKNFAWDFADNPKEIKLVEALGFAGSLASKNLKVGEADKIRFILSLQQNQEEGPLCVFCNLKSTAAELAARLTMNSVPADYIGGNLNPDRKRQIVDKALSWKGAYVLILTDEGAKGAERPSFSRVVNYDIPLEPELYFDRLAFLDRENESTLLYNLVCERYIYGVSAIERMIQKSLAPQPLDPGLVLPEDLSAGKEIPLPERRFDRRDRRRGRDDRTGRPERFDRSDRPDRPDRPGRWDRSDRNDRREDRRNDRIEERSNDRRDSRRNARQGAEPRDPYAMSMEERLALYKRRYGKAVQAGSSRSEGNPGSMSGSQATPDVSPGAKPTTSPQPRSAADSPAESKQEKREDGGQNPGGIFSKLQNLFGTRKEP